MKKITNKPARAYHTADNASRSDALYIEILRLLSEKKRYRDPQFSEQKLSELVGTSVRSIAASIALHSGDNYNALVNGYRLRDACRMLASPTYKDVTIEEIGLLAGFSSRQAFYLAFRRVYEMTPRTYRKERMTQT